MGVSLEAESWTWYGVAILVVVTRFTSRIIHCGGIKNLAVEDWLMLFVVAMYTVLVVTINIVAFADTNLIDPQDDAELTPESIISRIYGSKMVLVVEQCMITVQWSTKACLLLFYNKLTFGLKQHYAVKFVAAYAAINWAVMEVLYFGVWCRPFNQYWAVPTDNIQCSAAINHLITNTVFNISTDLMMLLIPLPLLIHSALEPIKKITLSALFSLGLFVMICAVMNKYYSFTEPFSPIWTFWYVREASVAILIANIPNCWPLLRRIFKLKSWNGTTINRSRTATYVSDYHQQRTLTSFVGNDISNPARFNARSRQGSKFGSAFDEIEEIDAVDQEYYSTPFVDQGGESSTTVPPATYRRNSSKTIDIEMMADNPFITSALDDGEPQTPASVSPKREPPWITWATNSRSCDTAKGGPMVIEVKKSSFDSSSSANSCSKV